MSNSTATVIVDVTAYDSNDEVLTRKTGLKMSDTMEMEFKGLMGIKVRKIEIDPQEVLVEP